MHQVFSTLKTYRLAICNGVLEESKRMGRAGHETWGLWYPLMWECGGRREGACVISILSNQQ